jgi:hypothetical protein
MWVRSAWLLHHYLQHVAPAPHHQLVQTKKPTVFVWLVMLVQMVTILVHLVQQETFVPVAHQALIVQPTRSVWWVYLSAPVVVLARCHQVAAMRVPIVRVQRVTSVRTARINAHLVQLVTIVLVEQVVFHAPPMRSVHLARAHLPVVVLEVFHQVDNWLPLHAHVPQATLVQLVRTNAHHVSQVNIVLVEPLHRTVQRMLSVLLVSRRTLHVVLVLSPLLVAIKPRIVVARRATWDQMVKTNARHVHPIPSVSAVHHRPLVVRVVSPPLAVMKPPIVHVPRPSLVRMDKIHASLVVQGIIALVDQARPIVQRITIARAV